MQLSGLRVRMRSFLKSGKGATAIEYCFIVAGIGLVIAGSVFVAGDSLEGFFASLPAVLAGG